MKSLDKYECDCGNFEYTLDLKGDTDKKKCYICGRTLVKQKSKRDNLAKIAGALLL